MVHIPHIQYETDSKKRMPPPQVKPRSRPAGKGHHWRGVGVGSGERALVLCSGKEGVAGPSTGSSYTGMTSGGGRITEASITDVERDSGPGSRTVGAPRVCVFSRSVGRESRWRPTGVCVSPFRAGIKHGPTLAGVVTSVASVVTVGHLEPHYLAVWPHILIDLWLSSRA